MSKDLFSKMLGFEWRGISFPCSSFETDVTQDHAEHKWPDRDGAHIEATGRNPIVINAKALFYNGIAPGQNESFRGGFLYPDAYMAFVEACADRSTGTLVHPELGDLQVKCKSCKTHWDADRRDGVAVDVVWVEHTESNTAVVVFRDDVSAQAAAETLDAAIGDYVRPLSPAQPFPERAFASIKFSPPGVTPMSFGELVNSVVGVLDQVSLQQQRVLGRINEVMYRLDVLSEAIDRTKDVKTWPIRKGIENLRVAMHDLKARPFGRGGQIGAYIVERPMTVAQICVLTQNTAEEFGELNNNTVASGPVIYRGIVVRYYVRE